jgi:microcystin-dependent protein
MSEQDWRITTDSDDYFQGQKKQGQNNNRRPQITKAADLVGPGIGLYCTRITDFDNLLATFNGYFSADVAAANAPNDTSQFVGQVVSDEVIGGTQIFTDMVDGVEYRRLFRRAPEAPDYLTWTEWINNVIDWLTAYPVGSIYMSVSDEDPADLFGGGTWVAWGEGRVPVGVDPGDDDFEFPELTGGEKDHTLTLAESPSHAHTINHGHSASATSGNQSANHDHTFGVRWEEDATTTGADTRVKAVAGEGDNSGGSTGTAHTGQNTANHNHIISVSVASHSGSSGSAGGDGSHNNLQPYITCYMFKRTA